MSPTAIEWAEDVWNPVTGCTRVSEGCDHCYIERTMPFRSTGRRFEGEGPGSTTGVILHSDRLDKPLHRKKPTRYFVNSLSDLFHEDVPDGFIGAVFERMGVADWHQFLILTKRPGRMASVLNEDFGGYFVANGLGWPLPNVWLGVSVENQKWADVRIPKLLDTPAAVRFLSCEPVLGPVDLGRWLLDGQTGADAHREQALVPASRAIVPIDWVIVGGESGPGARPMHPDWARSLRDQCVAAGVPFFFKQWGGATPKAGGRTLDGRTWDELPTREAALA